MVDVAARAGVSYQTVSRVVNGHPSVAIETRRRVEEAIEALEFRPNGAARALVTGQGSTVAVMASNTTLYGYAAILEGIEQAARQSGSTTTITVLDRDEPEDIAFAVRQILAQPLMGVIGLTHDHIGLAAMRLVPASVVGVGAGGSGSETRVQVTLEERKGAAMATQHLLDLGHRTVHHVAIPNDLHVTERSLGWGEALRAAGREAPEVIRATWLPGSGYEAGLELGRRGDVTAVLAGNDDLAVGVIRGLFDAGRRVPDDVSVVGFDDQPYTAYLRPTLTTVRQDFREMGRTAVALLREEFASPAPGRRCAVLGTELVVRESTAPPPPAA